MRARDKNLTVLSETEWLALYGLPDFDEFQRAEYLALTDAELALVQRRQGLPEQVLCLLQTGYFKAKRAFFSFTLAEAPRGDVDFLMQRYFPDREFRPRPIRKAEYYVQRNDIAALFGYRLWTDSHAPRLRAKAAQVALRDLAPAFILTELIAFLDQEKVVRPGYTTLQAIIIEALGAERARLGALVEAALDEPARAALQQLLVREDALSELSAIKLDAKHFGYRMMVQERRKRTILEPLYRLATSVLPRLSISQQNLNYYASLADYYTVYDLRRLKPGQTHLYLLCYAWQRYRQLTDNLVDAFGHHMKQLEDETKETAERQFAQAQANRSPETAQLGRLLLLYVDDALDDAVPFGAIRQQAYAIMPRDALLLAGRRLCEKPVSLMALRWQAVDAVSGRCRRHLRPLATALAFSGPTDQSPWLAALRWMKGVFSRQQKLSQRPLGEIPEGTIPKRLRPYLLDTDEAGNATGVRGDRYEFWVYRQIRKRLRAGELHLDDSIQHRAFSDGLVAMNEKAEAIRQLDIPWLRQPADAELDALFARLEALWKIFDRQLRQGTAEHLQYDPVRKTLAWRRPKADQQDTAEPAFYAGVPARDIADVFRLVNERCGFLAALTPLQPRYAKKIADEDSLMAVILAQAMNHGNLSMAETSDIPYHVLEATHRQYLRLATLRAANDRISNVIARLAIFPHYSFDLEVLYGAVDGQKFEAATPTAKARHSRKYFGKGKGIVAYTLLANHIPLQTELIGAHEHESYYVFDICYNNTSDVTPTTVTGDMHSVNKANFAILHWFGLRLAPRFTNPQAQVKQLYWGGPAKDCEDLLVQPAGRIDRELIVSEKANIDRIVATLALKETTQSILVRQLCALPAHNRTRKAVFEFDRLIRSIYTLHYLLDPQVHRNVHRSQNRIESYHQLRAAITQVSGRKQLSGRTDLDVAISNQCGRLLANVAIAYNSMLLSRLLERYQATGNRKALESLKAISPVAWQHIHFLGHYTFRGNKHPIDLEALLADVELG